VYRTDCLKANADAWAALCAEDVTFASPTASINIENIGTRTDASGRVDLSSRENLALVKIQEKWPIINHQATPKTALACLSFSSTVCIRYTI
jgi:hypothetical protein